MRFAARIACASLCTSSCFGTGSPVANILLVSSFRRWPVQPRCARCCWYRGLDALLELTVTQLHQGLLVEPQPGNAARSAARTSERVEGPRARRANRMNSSRASCQFQSSGTEPGGRIAAGSKEHRSRSLLCRRQFLRAARIHRRRCRHQAPALRVLPKVTSSPAMFCNSIATCSRTCPSQVPSSSRMRR